MAVNYAPPLHKIEYLIPGSTLPDGTLSVRSDVLGLDLRLIDGELRFFDPVTGDKLLSHAESEAARRQAEALVEQEAAARRQAEAELERLRAEIARLRGQSDG